MNEKKLRIMNCDPDKLNAAATAVAGIAKEYLGVANNAAWYCCLDALGFLEKLPQWRVRTDGRNTIKWRFDKAVKAFHEYERTLIWDENFRFFNVSDMPEKTRKLYKEGMSNREYYEFWTSLGGSTYTRTKSLITSLQNKYRLALLHKGADEAQALPLSWGLCALSCLSLAILSYERILDVGSEKYGVPRRYFDTFFNRLSIEPVGMLWADALDAVRPGVLSESWDGADARNVELGRTQIAEAWMQFENINSDIIQTLKDCGEDVIRTKKIVKEVIKEIKKNK